VKIDGINIEETIQEAKQLLEQERTLSPALKTTFNLLILIVQLFINRSGL